MANLYVMCGISGSGKSTYANKIKNSDTIIVSTDAIREMLFGDASIQSNGDLVFKIAYDIIESALKAGFDVIFDATNLHRRDRVNIVNKFNCLAKLHCIYMETPLIVAVRRQKLRDRKVPFEVIERQNKNKSIPDKSEGWDEILII